MASWVKGLLSGLSVELVAGEDWALLNLERLDKRKKPCRNLLLVLLVLLSKEGCVVDCQFDATIVPSFGSLRLSHSSLSHHSMRAAKPGFWSDSFNMHVVVSLNGFAL
jgi:hypothetical protein